MISRPCINRWYLIPNSLLNVLYATIQVAREMEQPGKNVYPLIDKTSREARWIDEATERRSTMRERLKIKHFDNEVQETIDKRTTTISEAEPNQTNEVK